MTIQEMDDVIQDYCGTNGGCPGCKLKTLCDSVGGDFVCNPNVCEQAYKLIVNVPVDNAVSHPSHYTQGGIECIQAMEAAYGKETTAHFCICNAFKYLWRTEHKNGKEDIDKAIWYLNKYKELKFNERTEAV